MPPTLTSPTTVLKWLHEEAFCNSVESMLFELKDEISILWFYTLFILANCFSMVLRVSWCVFSDFEWFLGSLERKTRIFSTAQITKIHHGATSAPPSGTPKWGHRHIDPKTCPVCTWSWPVWNMSSFGGRKVNLIEKILFLWQVPNGEGGGV